MNRDTGSIFVQNNVGMYSANSLMKAKPEADGVKKLSNQNLWLSILRGYGSHRSASGFLRYDVYYQRSLQDLTEYLENGVRP